MADSDGEYVADDVSDDESRVTSAYGTRSGRQPSARGAAPAASRAPRGTTNRRKEKGKQKAAWEDVKRSWDAVVEGADGSLAGAAELLLEAEKRRRVLRDTTPLQRGIIRHLVLVLDLSFAMADKDMLPNRFNRTMTLAAEFVREYFEQNPISQLAIVGMRDGVAVRLSDMSGSPEDHLEKLRQCIKGEPQGNPSLQNALEMCRGALFHTPSHGTREVLIVFGALLSSDPDDIHDTMARLIADRIRVSVIGLSAQVAICAELCSRTNAGSSDYYRIALDEPHFRELLLAATTPPVTRDVSQCIPSLLKMGFPSQTLSSGSVAEYCACHKIPVREGFPCTRCSTRLCRLPAECPACGLTLIMSTHIARSYHHLFPLRNWVEVSWDEARLSRECYACHVPFPEPPTAKSRQQIQKQHPNGNHHAKASRKRDGGAAASVGEDARKAVRGVSESSRYACEVCRNHFCVDCDVFAHEVLHNCLGCQSEAGEAPPPGEAGLANGHAADDMITD